MLIQRIELFEIRMPLRVPFRTSTGVMETKRVLLLKLEAEKGLHSWSECVAGNLPDYTPETIDTARQAIELWLVVTGH